MPDTNAEPRSVVRHAFDSHGSAPEPSLARQLSELARELQAEPDMVSLVQHIVAAIVEEVDGADHGGITLVEEDKVRAVAATSSLVDRLDERQAALGEGPCLSSLREQVTVRSDDLECERRWPKFVVAAKEEGIRSMLSVQLFVEGANLGALNLYATSPNAFTLGDEHTTLALAAHAAVAMRGSEVESNLRTAVESRDVIGQAKGILMERYRVGAAEAFNLLVLTSQRRHRKLRDIADDLAATGELRTE